MIHLTDVFVEYDNGVRALNGLNLSVDKGEFAFVVGSTGSGKSTFLRLLYREVAPSEGSVVVNGEDVANMKPADVPYLRRKLGIVFQDFKLLPQKNLWENLAFALRVIGASPRDIRRRIGDALALVGLTHRCDSFPHQMSGGEQQRAAIARALVNNPTLLIADEPTGNLDPDTSWEIMQLLDQINIRGATVLVATHDSQIVDRMKKRVIQLDSGYLIRDENKGTYQQIES
ncbi:MAG: cell division ATP-binding protein FtsE [Armatimonadetes bacterium]|jgi:cell division transport system ATP-binding protein|nr:cell division ATP-binding protein FtsE [Armatimonadota bacterium]